VQHLNTEHIIKFNLKNFNKANKMTFGKLYEKTFNRFKILKENGYDVKYIWESDWKDFKNGINKTPKIVLYNYKSK
jgi:hypothetical protein